MEEGLKTEADQGARAESKEQVARVEQEATTTEQAKQETT